MMLKLLRHSKRHSLSLLTWTLGVKQNSEISEHDCFVNTMFYLIEIYKCAPLICAIFGLNIMNKLDYQNQPGEVSRKK